MSLMFNEYLINLIFLKINLTSEYFLITNKLFSNSKISLLIEHKNGGQNGSKISIVLI